MNKYRIEYDEEQKIEELLLYKKKEKRYFIMAIIGIALIFGIIYVGSQILFDIFFGGKK